MPELIKVSTEKLEYLALGQGCCRLLSKLHYVETVGKKDKSRDSRSVITESNVTSVLGDKSSNASVNSSLGGSRQIRHVASWECCNIT
jgi:hypothetical protein